MKSWMEKNGIALIVKQQRYLHFSCGKIDKYEHLTGEQILTLEQNALKKQAESNFSLLGKALEK